jgi:hypothetical protein
VAYNTPHTATPLAIITSSGHNTSIRDNLEYLKGRAGTIAFEAGASFQGSLAVVGDINIGGTGKKVTWPREVGVKDDYTGIGEVLVGVDVSTLYWRADGHYSWRDQTGAEKMHLNFAGSPLLTVGGNTVWHEGNDGSNSNLDAHFLEATDKAGILAAALGAARTDATLAANVVATIPANLEVATGNYTGDGSNNRPIPVPFVPNWAMIAGGNSDATVEQYILFNVLGSARDSNAGNTTYSTGARLSSGNTELVVSAAGANVSGKNYWWVAMR